MVQGSWVQVLAHHPNGSGGRTLRPWSAFVAVPAWPCFFPGGPAQASAWEAGQAQPPSHGCGGSCARRCPRRVDRLEQRLIDNLRFASSACSWMSEAFDSSFRESSIRASGGVVAVVRSDPVLDGLQRRGDLVLLLEEVERGWSGVVGLRCRCCSARAVPSGTRSASWRFWPSSRRPARIIAETVSIVRVDLHLDLALDESSSTCSISTFARCRYWPLAHVFAHTRPGDRALTVLRQ